MEITKVDVMSNPHAPAAFGMIKDLAPLVIGMDPMNNEQIWNHLHRHTFWGMGGGAVISAGMAAIDIALWDIRGKALNVPVWKLLGGKTNDQLRFYASQLLFGWGADAWTNGLQFLNKPEEYYDVVKKAVADGYDAVKIDPIFVDRNGAGNMDKQGTQIRGAYRCPGSRRRRSRYYRGNTQFARCQHLCRTRPGA